MKNEKYYDNAYELIKEPMEELLVKLLMVDLTAFMATINTLIDCYCEVHDFDRVKVSRRIYSAMEDKKEEEQFKVDVEDEE